MTAMPGLTRRRWLAVAATAVGQLLLDRNLLAQSPLAKTTSSEQLTGGLVTAATQSSIDRGLAWLASRQSEDGSFPGGGYGRNVAVCSLAGMAFLSSGSTPSRGKYGKPCRRALDYVTSCAQETGFICQPTATSHGPMYDHGFGTLLLAECYGMSAEKMLRERLSAAIKLIVSSQNDEGGWRYEPKKSEADISVTICQIMALRAARNAGIYIPNETIERCTDYVKRCQNSDGGFMYMLQGGPSRFPRSAAGVVALYSAGIYDGDEIARGLDYLEKELPRADDPGGRDAHYMYGHYYAVQAMWHAGGTHWAKWYPAIRDSLLSQQEKNGSWEDAISNEYGTAMACIILQMPNNYLPIFQR